MPFPSPEDSPDPGIKTRSPTLQADSLPSESPGKLFASINGAEQYVLFSLAFYFVLDYFDTANMLPSTVSIATRFLAVYLTFRRSPYFALAYAANDVVLIVLWTLAALEDISYISVIICFAMFLVNDLYGYISWKRMEKRQMGKC